MDERQGNALLTRTITVLVLIAATTFSPLSAEVGAKGAVIKLGRVTTIVGSSPARIPVHIPKSVRISTDRINRSSPNGAIPNVRISGSGEAVGIALTQYPASDHLDDRFFLAVRFDNCAQRQTDCPQEDRYFNSAFVGRKVIPRGDYLLHLITESAPARVVLRLPGLNGRTTIEPRDSYTLDTNSPEPTSEVSPTGGTTYSAGAPYAVGTRGFVLAIVLGRASERTDMEAGICDYVASAPPDGAAYGPHCNELARSGVGARHGAQDVKGFSLSLLAAFSSTRSLPPNITGERGLGAWITSSQPLRRMVTHGLFLSYD